MNTKICRLILTLAMLAAGLLSLRADPALLGHKGLAAQKLDAEGVKAVLLGKKNTIGADRAVIVIAKAGDSQEAFLKEHLGMTTGQFQTHWRRLFMTGGGSAPKVVETEADALKLVSETAGAIAIGDSSKAGDLAVLSTK